MTYRRRQKTISAQLLNEAEAIAIARRRGELGSRPETPADFYGAREDGKIVALKVVGANFNRYDVLPILGPDGSTPTPSTGSNQFQGCSGNPLDSDEFQRLAGFIEGTSTYNGAGTGIGSAHTLFAVLLDQIKSGEVGPAKISGHFAREITVNYAHHRFARMSARSPNTMESALSGPFRIKARHNNLGATYPRTEWVILEANAWQPGLIFEGKSDAAIAKGATGTVSVWDSYTGTFADTGENVTVTNRYGAISAAGKVLEFKIPLNAAYYSVTNAEC
jgi:hypothetical protein